MNTDDFEQRLKRQPLRRVPLDWRDSILRAAGEQTSSLGTRSHPALIRAVVVAWHELIVPCRYAWSGLAAVWLGLLVVNAHTRSADAHEIARPARLAAQRLLLLEEQRRILVELTGPIQSPASEPPRRTQPKPRSERIGEVRAC